MKLSVFSPHGNFGRESGVLYLVANYLMRQGAEGVQLRCDGAVNTCGRDRKHNWNRTAFSCTRCMAEQKASADWSTLRAKTLSSFILPDDVMQSKKWIASVSKAEVRQCEFRGIPLWDICKDDIGARFGDFDVAAASPVQDAAVRDLLLSAVHTLVGVDRFITTVGPTLHLIAGGKDLLTTSYATVAKNNRYDAAVFTYDPHEEVIAVEALLTGARYTTKLVLDNITTMRTDPKTWAPEVTAIMHEMLTFLGFAPDKTPGDK